MGNFTQLLASFLIVSFCSELYLIFRYTKMQVTCEIEENENCIKKMKMYYFNVYIFTIDK